MAPTSSEKLQLKTSFNSAVTIESIYTGGKVSITEHHLVTTVGSDIEVTDLTTGRRVRRFEGDSEPVTTFTVTPDEKYLVSCSRSLIMRVWKFEDGSLVRSKRVHDAPVIVMDIDTTSTLCATGSADTTLKVWDLERGYCTHNFKGHGGVVSAVKFHPEKKRWMLVSGSDDCTIRIWDLQKRSCLAIFESHVSVIRGLDFTYDGQRLLSGSRDKVVNVWDLDKHILLKTFPVYETLETVGVLAPGTKIEGKETTGKDKEMFYTGGDKGIIRIWGIETGNLITSQEPEINSKHTISDVIYSPKLQQVAAVTSDQNILFYSIPSGLKRRKQIVGFNDEIVDVVYVGAEETHLAVATNSEQIRIFDLNGFNCDIVYGHSDIVLSLDRVGDGSLLASGSKDNSLRIWAIDPYVEKSEDRYRCVAICIGHTEAIGAVAFSKKSKNFVMSGSQDRTVKCWDLTELDTKIARSDEFRPRALFTNRAHDKDINSICVAPNDKVYATGSQDKTAKVWDTADGRLLGTCTGHKRGVWSVQFSPTDQVLATSSGDKTIKIWSLKDFSCLKTFEGHTNSVLKVAFLTAGTQLISAGSDGLVKLWNIRRNECATTLDNHTEKIWGLTVRHDEKFVVSAGADSVINFWEDVTIEEQEAAVKRQEDVILKEQELANFLLKKDYRNAILLAMSLEQPFRLLNLFTEVMKDRPTGDTSMTGSFAVDEVLAAFSNDQLARFFKYIRDWNTNARYARISQTLLYAVLHFFTSEQLMEVPGIKEIMDALLPYTERHYQRVDELLTQSFVVDYTLYAMDLMIGGVDSDKIVIE